MKKLVYIFSAVLITAIPFGALSQTNDPVPYGYNSVRKEIVKVKGIKDETQISSMNATDKVVMSAYADGLGRPLANVTHQATPVRHDLIQLYAYDALGRIDTVFLPFAAPSSNGVFIRRGQHVMEQKQFYQDAADRVADDTHPFGINVFDNAPQGYIKEQGATGAEWQPGTSHTLRRTFRKNNTSEFRIWRHDHTSPGYYIQSELIVEEVTDEKGSKIINVTDKTGKTIEKHVQSGTSTWLKTLYTYDEKGRINSILQPEGVKLLASGSTISATLLDDQAFRFVYDTYDRLVEKKIPGVAAIYYAYDPLGRLALIQDGNLRQQNKWTYIKYDRNNRPVMEGIYTNTSQVSRTAIQQDVLDVLSYSAGENFYEKKVNGGDHSYTNNSFPTSGTEVLTVSYYGDYDLDMDNSSDWAYTSQSLTNEGTPVTPVGQLTATKVKVLNESTWITTYLFYDRYGNMIQSRSNNHLSSTLDNLVTRVYDFNGRPLLSKTYHNIGGGNNVTVLNRYTYDHTGRLLQVFQKNNSDLEVMVASYRYNDLGQMVSKNLHCSNCTDEIVNPNGTIYAYNIVKNTPQSTGTELVAHNSIKLLPGLTSAASGTFKARISSPAELEVIESNLSVQSIDYRYNIRGWLTSINNAQLNADQTKNDDTNDFFGMELLYNRSETGLNDQSGDERYWNGNISAIKWKGPGKDAGPADQRAYRYKYDKANRLESAKFQAIDISAWSTELNAFNELMTYDDNGNIKTLQRNQRKHEWVSTEATYTNELIDNLTYTYANTNQSNLLLNVHDEATIAGGFSNGSTSTSAQEYFHDIAGNLTKDDNKLISNVTYNVLGKAQQVTFSGGQTLQYTYDASGNKLKTVFTNGSPLTTHYVNGFVYEGSTLRFFSSPEGRVVKTTSGTLEYQYAISDHQGNTRVVFSSVTPAPEAPVATFGGDPNDQSSQFTNVVAGNVVTFSSANQTPGGSKVVRLNQTYKTGPARNIKVFPGDAIDMEAWTYYEGTSGWSSTNTGVGAFITNVAAGFGGSPTGSPEAQAIYNGIDVAYGAFGMGGNKGDARPSAYLNFILFDKDYKLLDMGWTAVPESANSTRQKISIPTVKVTEPGYIFVYLSYEAESNNWVYFDDFKVTHSKTKVLQYNEYYPFGLLTSTSWTREGHSNNFLYNAGSEFNMNTQWYETMFRGYDAALGRFLQVDAHAVSYSDWTPYNFAFNDPVFWNDPLGLDGNPGFSQDVWDLLNQAWDATPAGGSAAFSMADGIFTGYSINGDGWNLTGGAMGGGGGCDYCPGSTSDHALYAAMENQYGKWYNLGDRWLDVSTAEQRLNRIQAKRQSQPDLLEAYGLPLGIVETSLMSGGVTLPGLGIFVQPNSGNLTKHELGHYLQFLRNGGNYFHFYSKIGVPSLYNAAEDKFVESVLGIDASKVGLNHSNFRTETDANQTIFGAQGQGGYPTHTVSPSLNWHQRLDLYFTLIRY